MAGDAQHVADVGTSQLQLNLTHPLDAVGCHPGKRHLWLDDTCDHGQGQLHLGGEGNVVRHMRRPPAGQTSGPGFGQIELTVDESVDLFGDVGPKESRSGSW